MLNKHNVFREIEGLELLVESSILNEVAFKHAKRMARLCWLNDHKLSELLVGLDDYEIIVWNISLGSNPEVAIKKLINDPEHRSKILGDYQHFGHGSYKGRNDIRYHCMLYGKLK
jgi:uncharacterized protein YkwD